MWGCPWVPQVGSGRGSRCPAMPPLGLRLGVAYGQALGADWASMTSVRTSRSAMKASTPSTARLALGTLVLTDGAAYSHNGFVLQIHKYAEGRR
jgi:hypothetical protein